MNVILGTIVTSFNKMQEEVGKHFAFVIFLQFDFVIYLDSLTLFYLCV